MTRQILIILFFFLAAIKVSADPRWKMHTTFDGEIDHIFETPEYVYYTSRAIPDMDGQRRMSLFRYDKEGEEMQVLSTDNVLTSNTVSIVQYNPKKSYVVTVGTNYDITFIYDDGRVVTMPDYRLANISKDKTVNSITVDPWNDRVYLATTFGYLAVNDEKYEIAESRDYGKDIKGAARIGDMFVILEGTVMLYADSKSARLSIDEYTPMEYGTPYQMAMLTDTQCLVFNNGGSPQTMNLVEYKDGKLESRQLDNNVFYTISNNDKGVLVATRIFLRQVEPDGVVTTMEMPEENYSLKVGSYDMSEVWHGKQRSGIKSSRPGASPSQWTVTRDYMGPNSPSPFVMPEMVMHPTKGVMVPSYGYDYTFLNYPQNQPLLLSGYKDGWWTNYSPVYANEKRGALMTSNNGVAVDPDNPDYVYIASTHNGLLRLNLSDPDDIIHMSRPADRDNGNDGFVVLVENQVGDNGWCCNFSTPRFDSYGNLWVAYADMDNQNPKHAVMYCWEAADRKATTSADNIILPKRVEAIGPMVTNRFTMLPLTTNANKDLLIYSARFSDGEFAIIDTKGTPVDTSDDEVRLVNTFTDQDGGSIDVSNPRFFKEDPSTGNVWVGHSNGVFYFNPKDFMGGGNGVCRRIKVARNDGTNLADYLLEGVVVNNMATDGRGRKWFGTTGGGIVITSSDGRTVEQEINTDNSPIPSDNVYGMMYIPTTNSMLIATSEGIAEYYLSADASGDGDSDLKIYPNPVRPDYFGYVTIEGLPDRSLVKIVDASGNIVKEMGPVSGDVRWDVTNHQYKRVGSGVYFVLASAGENESAFSTVGKILVVN